jgi:hypothetical protein
MMSTVISQESGDPAAVALMLLHPRTRAAQMW